LSNQTMKFCLNMVHTRPLSEVINWWKAADEAGIHMLGLPDSPARQAELYVASTLCALNTSRIKFMSSITNPVTRHPSVTAGGLFVLDELAPGRVGLGIGTGDGALWSIGMKKAATVAHLKEYILAVKGLLRGEEVEYRGRQFRGEWRDGENGSVPKEIPIYVSCSGPKVLKMASQVADGMVIQMGYAPENIQYVRGIIKESCEEVGRNPDDLDIWWTTELIFGSSVEDSMKENLGVNIGWVALTSMEGKQVPEEYKEPLKTLVGDMHTFAAGYSSADVGPRMVQRAKQLGVYDWILSRAPGLWGTPNNVSRRLEELAAMGLTNWMFFVGRMHIDRLDMINKLSKEVLPNFV
jgi:5,10-methylenetetrahydromethanopterin reductase